MSVLGFALAGAIGLVLGLLGGGGSILTVPVFVYVLDIDPKQAIAMSMPVVGLTSLAGLLGHWREGHLRVRRGLMVGGVAMAAAYAGARLGVELPSSFQLLVLAATMVLAAGSMLRGGSSPQSAPETGGHEYAALVLPASAVGIGLLTGLVGIGGGFLFVPVLVLAAGMRMADAVGTSLLIIVMNALAGFAGYVGRVPVAWDLVGLFTAAATVGAVAGVYLMRFVPQRGLQRGFGVFLLLVSGLMLFQNLHAARASHRTASEIVRSDQR